MGPTRGKSVFAIEAPAWNEAIAARTSASDAVVEVRELESVLGLIMTVVLWGGVYLLPTAIESTSEASVTASTQSIAARPRTTTRHVARRLHCSPNRPPQTQPTRKRP